MTATHHVPSDDPKPRKFRNRLITDQRVTVTNLGDGLTKSKRVDGTPEFVHGQTYFVLAESVCAHIGYDDVEGTKNVEEAVKLKASTVFIVDEDLVAEMVQRQKARIAEAELADRLEREEAARAEEEGQQLIVAADGGPHPDALADDEPGNVTSLDGRR